MFSFTNAGKITWKTMAKAANTGSLDSGDTVPKSTTEVPVVENIIVENWYSYHHCYVVQCDVYAKAAPGQRQQLEGYLDKHPNEIKAAVRTVLADAELDDLRDPELKYVKQEIKKELLKNIGQSVIEEILVPKWNGYDRR